jgi:hypothetical protein
MRAAATQRQRISSVVLRLDRALIVAVIAGALLWIEHGHRVNTETPAGTAFAATAGAACPDNENVPYSTDCITFMQGGVASGLSNQAQAKSSTSARLDASGPADLRGPACPSSENVPYSANCIRFMTGWFWRAN